MSWHLLIVDPMDGPLDPDEAAGGYWDECPLCSIGHDPEDGCPDEDEDAA